MPFAKFEDTIAARNAGPAKFSLRSKLHVGSALAGVTAALVAFAPAPAMAATCPTTATGTITCSNPLYMGGIYDAPTQDLTIVVEEGVTINATGGTGVAIEAYAPDITATIINHGTITNATNGLVTYDYHPGYTRDATVITNTGSITATNNGIHVMPGGTYATVTNNGSIVAANGIHVTANQDVTVTGTGSITGTAMSGTGIRAGSNYGTASVETGSVTMTAAGAKGINASGQTGATVVATSVSTNGANAITAMSPDGAVTVTATGAITTGGHWADGVNAYSYNGDVTVDVASVDTTGNFSDAIDAKSAYGSVSVTATGAISTQGDDAYGVRAIASYFGASEGAVTVNVASVSTAGDSSDAIFAKSNLGAVSVTATGAISTQGDTAFGVRAIASYYGASEGAVTVNVASVSTAGDMSHAILAQGSAGAVSVTATGALSTEGHSATAVDAYSYSGDVTVNVASVETTGNGSDAINAESAYGSVSVTATGAISTQGDDAFGVRAVTSYYGASEGTATVNVASVSTVGDRSDAIFAKSDLGAVSVTATGAIMTEGQWSGGVIAESRNFNGTSNGTVSVDVASVSTIGNSSGAIVAASDLGAVTVTATGAISTEGNFSAGVVATSDEGDVTVNVASVSTMGHASDAVYAVSDSGAVTVTATGALSTAGDDSKGVYAASNDGDIAINVASVSTTGYASDAVYALGYSSAVTITASGAISTEGENAWGVAAWTDTGDITIDVASVRTTGDDSTAVNADSDSGAVSVTASGTISTAGDFSTGVDAHSSDGDVTVNVASVATTGYRSDALDASSSGGAVTINATGAITTEGDNATGVGAYSYNGDVTVNVASVSTTGRSSNAIDAYSYSGAVSVTATGAISTVSDFSRGVKAYSSDSDVTVKVASVATTGYASNAIDASSYSGAVSVTATGAISTADDFSTGVYAYSIDGDVTVNVASVATTGYASNAIYASSDSGAVSVTATGAISTVGDFSRGVGAYSTDGDVTVNAASVSTAGFNSNAIEASSNSGAVSVTATGHITTDGDDSKGVFAVSQNGDVSVDVASVTTTGASSTYTSVYDGAHAIFAESDTGSVSVTASGTISTAGEFAVGVIALSGETTSLDIANVETSGQFGVGVAAMGLEVSGNVGRVSTQGDYAMGVMVQGWTIDLAVGNASTAGANAHAISAMGGETLNLRVANASTQGARSDAVNASSHDGDISVTVTGAVSTAGNQSQGVQASSTYGNVEVNIGSSGARVATFARMAAAPGITTTGDNSHGILATSAYGTVTVASTGAIAVTGAGSNGIGAYAEGATTVTAGDTSAASGHAIHAISTGGLSSVTATGAVHSADREAILVEGATGVNVGIAAGGSVSGATSAIVANGPSTTITNAGTLNAGSAPTIVATGGTVDFTNSGTFNGNVHFGAGDDSITNTGRFLASGTSDFGAGNNVFTNSGLFVAAGSVELTNLETFNNSGVISLGNGAVGDVLTISGNYVGNGGQMVFDFRNSQGTVESDRIHILGNATGTTGIRLSNVGTAALPLGTQVKLIEVDGTTSAGAFSIAGGQNIGFGFYELEYDAATNSFNVSASVGENLFRTLKISEGAQVLWNKSADVWSAHLQAQRDGTAGQDASARGRIWGQFHGSIDKRSQTFVYEDAFATQNVDLSYRQDHFGGQMGVDFGSLDSTGLTYGVTGGYTNSSLKFAQSVDRTEYDAYNLGAYFGASRGSFFVNALAKYDLYKVKTSSPAGGFTDRFDGKGYGVQLEGGARLGGKGFFVEPIVGITYNRIDLDTLQALGATVEFEKFDGLRGKIGARLGGARAITGGVLTYYAGAHVVKEFEGKDGVRLNAGSYSERFANDPIGTYGQFQLGVNVASRNGVTGFFEANANTSEDYKGYGGRAGIRIGL